MLVNIRFAFATTGKLKTGKSLTGGKILRSLQWSESFDKSFDHHQCRTSMWKIYSSPKDIMYTTDRLTRARKTIPGCVDDSCPTLLLERPEGANWCPGSNKQSFNYLKLLDPERHLAGARKRIPRSNRQVDSGRFCVQNLPRSNDGSDVRRQVSRTVPHDQNEDGDITVGPSDVAI